MKKQPYILIIEDSRSQALRLQLMLKQVGYDVRIASDGADGWQRARETRPTVILLDVNLPEMNGFDVLAHLKEEPTTANIPVVMLTSLDKISDVEQAITLGADGYLFKDDCLFRADGVRQIVDTVHQFINAEIDQADQEQPHILVIEDSRSQALRLQLMIQQMGYEHITIARDGAEGWHRAYESRPTIILLDINLPVMDGFEVLMRLKRDQTTAHIPVVMLTCQDSVGYVEEAVALGADGYLFKDDCLFRPEGARQIGDTIDQLVHPPAPDDT